MREEAHLWVLEKDNLRPGNVTSSGADLSSQRVHRQARLGRWRVKVTSPLDGHKQELPLLVWVRASRKAAGRGEVEASLGEVFAVRQQRQNWIIWLYTGALYTQWGWKWGKLSACQGAGAEIWRPMGELRSGWEHRRVLSLFISKILFFTCLVNA